MCDRGYKLFYLGRGRRWAINEPLADGFRPGLQLVALQAVSAQAHGERLQAAEDDVLFVAQRVGCERQGRGPAHKRAESEPALQAREWGTEAEVDSQAEGEMAASRPGQV